MWATNLTASRRAAAGDPLQRQHICRRTGFSHADAMSAAYSRYYTSYSTQTQLLAFMDCFFMLGVMTLVAAPLVLFAKSVKSSGKPSEAH